MMEYKQIETSWKKILDKEVTKPYFKKLCSFLTKERAVKQVFPKKEEVFAPFSQVPLEFVKVVIVGQDPYHTKDMATGHAFAVHPHQKTPPSLKNIYKEIESDTAMPAENLITLTKQGVFLLNTILTVEEGAPLSHKNQGWERFTDEVLKILWEKEEKIVFLLWGNSAKRKEKEIFIKDKGHLILKAGHPSPLSARFFLGCKHFTKANAFLKKERGFVIDWNKREE